MLRKKFRAGLFYFAGENGIPLGHAVAKDAARQFDAGDEQHELAGENFFQQVSHGKFDVHLAGRGVAGVEVREARLFRRILDEPPVEQQPENQDDGGDVKDGPRGVHRIGRGNEDVVQEAGGIRLGHSDDGGAPVEREIDADGNQRAENRAEDAAFADVKPIRLDLDDGHRAEALEIHVDRVEQREAGDEVDLQIFCDDEPGEDAEGDVGQRRADGGNDHPAFAAEFFVNERAVDQKGQRINPGAHAKNDSKV